MKFKVCTAVIAMALSLASVARAQELRCEIAEQYVCEGGGCKIAPASADVWNLIDQTKKTYARCTRMGCETFEATFSKSGAYMNIELPGQNVIARMADEDVPFAGIKAFSFHEAITFSHAIFVSFGTCKRP